LISTAKISHTLRNLVGDQEGPTVSTQALREWLQHVPVLDGLQEPGQLHVSDADFDLDANNPVVDVRQYAIRAVARPEFVFLRKSLQTRFLEHSGGVGRDIFLQEAVRS
jgi:hypothetical protein